MSALIARFPDREKLRLLAALAFWAVTYLLFLTWNHLQSDALPSIWRARRLLATMVGAALFFGFTSLADRVADRRPRERLFYIGATFVACCAIMVVARAAIDLIVPAFGEAASSMERHLRFTFIWTGYFTGGVLAFLTFAPGQQAARKQLEEVATPSAEDPGGKRDALWVSRGRETVRVPIDAIEWIEAEGDYVRLHAHSGGGLLRGPLSSLEAELDSAGFARVHRSAICRRSAIVAIMRKPSGALALRLSSGAEVPVGRRYRESVEAVLSPPTAA
jgi:DNA-binding LytR/AlgR family response regulator